MRRYLSVDKSRRLCGFTLIELLVFIAIVGVLAALILPEIQSAREAARRAQCMSQMRNVSTALHSYATAHNGRLPHLRQDSLPLNTASGAPGSGTEVLSASPWCVQLLPFIEQSGLFDRLQTSFDSGAADPDSTPALLATSIQSFTCPDDPDAEGDGTLSFVANAGYTMVMRWVFEITGSRGTVDNTTHTASGYNWAFNGHTPPNARDHEVTQGIRQPMAWGHAAPTDRMRRRSITEQGSISKG
jgi:prepilin-type N-terminal cleavage/methylation domain-containing protein